MASQRLILLTIALLSTVAVVLSATTKPNHLTLGKHVAYDHIVHNEHVVVPSKWFQIVKQQKTFSADHGENITMVQFLDQNLKGNGATVTVLAGGPGFPYVTAQFKSIRGHSINFIVELFGK